MTTYVARPGLPFDTAAEPAAGELRPQLPTRQPGAALAAALAAEERTAEASQGFGWFTPHKAP